MQLTCSVVAVWWRGEFEVKVFELAAVTSGVARIVIYFDIMYAASSKRMPEREILWGFASLLHVDLFVSMQ